MADYIASFTPVLGSLPAEFGGYGRLAAAFSAVIGIFLKAGKADIIRKLILPVTAALGLIVLLETGMPYVLDLALAVMMFACVDMCSIAVTVFTFFSCVTGATVILALKGYVRVYVMDGQSSWGFVKPSYLWASVIIIVLSLGIIIGLLIKDKKIKPLLIKGIFAGIISAALVVAVLKAQNLAAPVEAGSYEIYGRDTALALEVRMKGFEDYDVGFGRSEASSFTIIPSGDDFMITVDSYGITKTICVLDGELVAGNYDQATPAHTWSVTEIAGTPYFTIRNLETGLMISMDDSGNLILKETEDETCYLRIGSENLDYYKRISYSAAGENDISNGTEIYITSEETYTGSAITPEVVVTYRGIRLTEGTDYTLNYWNNYLPGTAHADITGIGEYSGTKNVTFTIVYGNPMLDDPFYLNTSDYVVRVYRMAYLRFPTIDEVRDYVQILVGSNRTPDSVIWEVYNNGGFDVSDAQFIEALYRLMLLRNGSRDELTLWINELKSGSTREDVIDAISVSPDYQNIWHNFGIGYR